MKTEVLQQIPASSGIVIESKRCAFCWPSEHGKHGEVKREWSIEWTMFIPVCRKHAQEINDQNLNLDLK